MQLRLFVCTFLLLSAISIDVFHRVSVQSVKEIHPSNQISNGGLLSYYYYCASITSVNRSHLQSNSNIGKFCISLLYFQTHTYCQAPLCVGS